MDPMGYNPQILDVFPATSLQWCHPNYRFINIKKFQHVYESSFTMWIQLDLQLRSLRISDDGSNKNMRTNRLKCRPTNISYKFLTWIQYFSASPVKKLYRHESCSIVYRQFLGSNKSTNLLTPSHRLKWSTFSNVGFTLLHPFDTFPWT